MQSVDAEPWQGKTVRFRAAVRTDELIDDARAQLWLRVDRPDGELGAFDNMDPRPIKSSEWDHYAIVVKIADDAENISLGMFVIGKGKAWLDDASFEEVSADAETSDMDIGSTQAATVAVEIKDLLRSNL